MMNIIFFHNNGIIPSDGGISRITSTLGKLFSENGNNIWYLGIVNTKPNYVYSKNQLFLPIVNLFDEANIEYLKNIVREKSIDVLINQAALNPNSVLFLKDCIKEDVSFKIITCVHNSILTPAIHAAYLKEYYLKKHGLGLIFYLMKLRPIAKLIYIGYKLKYKRRFISILDNSDEVVVLNNGQKRELLKMCDLKKSSIIRVIPNCLDLIERPSKEKENIVLWVGTFDFSIKRPDYMIRIWRMVEPNFPNWKLQMLGDGVSFLEMKKLAKSLGLHNIEFIGRRNPQDYYSKAKITCVTSVHESFSLVIAESMTNGVVPIAFNSFTAASLLINNYNDGVLVPSFKLDLFANNLSRLMDNKSDLIQMRNEAIKSIRRFSFESIYNMWKKCLNQVNNE